MDGRLLVIIPATNSSKAESAYRTFKETSTRNSDLVYCIRPNIVNQFPIVPYLIRLTDSYGQGINKAIDIYNEFEYYMLGHEDMWFQQSAWDLKIAEIMDAMNDIAVVCAMEGTAPTISRKLLETMGGSVPEMDHPNLWAWLRRLGDETNSLFYTENYVGLDETYTAIPAEGDRCLKESKDRIHILRSLSGVISG